MTMPQLWTARALHDAIATADLCRNDQVSIELIEGADASLRVTMHEYGDLPIYIAVIGEQIIAEALLWPASEVNDYVRFNEEVLRTHKLFPLSCISIESLPDGQPCYTMFGALSSASTLSDVVLEIELLADNVIKATEAYESFLKPSA